MIDRYQFLAEVINNDEEYFDFGEQEICRQFGCGKKLTREEKLFGDKCIAHNGEKLILVNKSEVINIFLLFTSKTATK